MKKLLSTLLISIIAFAAFAQGGPYNRNKLTTNFYPRTYMLINDTSGTTAATSRIGADSSAVMIIRDTTRGVLLPRMTGAQAAAIADKSHNLLVVITDSVNSPLCMWDTLNSKFICFKAFTDTSTWARSGNDQYATNSGNVGIGTTAPHSKLTIYGSFSDSAQLSYGTGAVIAAGDSIRALGFVKSGIVATNGYSAMQLTDDRAQGKTLWHWAIGNNFAKSEGDSIEIRFKAGGKTLYYDNSGFYSINYDSLGKSSRPWIRGYIDSLYALKVKITPNAGASKVLTSDAVGDGTWQTIDAMNVDYSNVPEYPDNATAVFILGVGKLYYTDDSGEYFLKVTHP